MKKHRQTLQGFLMGLLTALALFATIGAVNNDTANHAGDSSTSFNAVATTTDGEIVYVTDNDKVYRSTDGGANWQVILKKSR